ncbi:hypothetical protein [Cyanobium sp. ULC065]
MPECAINGEDDEGRGLVDGGAVDGDDVVIVSVGDVNESLAAIKGKIGRAALCCDRIGDVAVMDDVVDASDGYNLG